MLIVATAQALWNLDHSYALAEDASVTALAAQGGTVWALFDGERIERLEAFDVQPEGVVSPADGQSLAVLPSGTIVVGRAGARLAKSGPGGGGTFEPVASFEAVPGRESWGNPANATPDLRSLSVSEAGRL